MKKIYLVFTICIILSTSNCLAKKFQRIISLAPSITKSIYHLGQEARLVGITSYCYHPKEAKLKDIIGNPLNLNIEKIFSLSPDLVLASKGINQQHVVKKLQSLGLNIIAFNEGNNIEEIFEIFLKLGSILGVDEKATQINNKVKIKIDSIFKKTQKYPAKRIFWQLGSNPLVTIGLGSFVNDYFKYAGATNIFSISKIRYPRVNSEEVLRKNPEIIILISMGNITTAQKDEWMRFKQIDAVKNNKVFIVDGDKFCLPIPLYFLSGLEELIGLFHPEIQF